MKQLLELMNAPEAVLAWPQIAMNLGITLMLALVLFFAYRMTYSGVAYSRSFNVSIVMTAMVTAIVMMVIGNNLALSLGMVGALSIVRFRAAVKEPKDISYLFWGLAIGLSAGTGAYGIAIIGTLAMTFVVLAFHVTAKDHGASYLLVVKGEAFSTDAVARQVKSATRRQRLKMQNTSLDAVECVFEVKIRPASEADIVKSLRDIEGVRIVNLVSYHGEIGG